MITIGSVGASVATVDWGDVSVVGEDSSVFDYSRVRENIEQRSSTGSVQRDDGPTGKVRCMIRDLLTFFLSLRGIPLPLRDGVLGPKRSKKLILTGWPFAFRKGAMIYCGTDHWLFCVMAEQSVLGPAVRVQ